MILKIDLNYFEVHLTIIFKKNHLVLLIYKKKFYLTPVNGSGGTKDNEEKLL